MKTEIFIAKRLLKDKKHSVISGAILNISISGIAIGIVVMVMSIFITTGFKNEIKNKLTGFTGHLTISYFDDNTSLEAKPISKKEINIKDIQAIKEVKQVIPYALKGGIIKKDDIIEGIVFKGIETNKDNQFFNTKIIEGTNLDIDTQTTTNKILISRKLQNILNVNVNENIIIYFVQDPPRARKLKICGIYETGLEDFDKTYIIGDIKHIRRLNSWEADHISGLKIMLHNFDDIEKTQDDINGMLPYNMVCNSVKQQNSQITDWLNLTDTNVFVILFLIILVSGINMISTLLIIVLEKINMIGLLKAVGAKNISIRKIFLFLSAFIVIRGIIIGNIIAITLSYMQYKFKFLKLSQESYYISYVPIDFDISNLLLVNIITITACIFMLLIPSMIISKILPIKSLQYQ